MSVDIVRQADSEPMTEPEWFPLRRAGQLFPGNPSAQTLARWHLSGVRSADGSRIRLDAIRSGGRLFIDEQCAARFLAQLNASARTAGSGPSSPDRLNQKIDHALDELGF